MGPGPAGQGLVRHGDDPRVRADAQFVQDPRVVERHRIQPQGSRPPFHRSGIRGRRSEPVTRGRRLHLRFAPQPRRDPCQVLFGGDHPGRGQAGNHHEGLPGWRDSQVSREDPVQESQGPGGEFRALRHPGRDFREESRSQPGAWRLDARVLHAVRFDAQQRHRRRLCRHCGRFGAVQAHQPQERHRDSQHRRRVNGLRTGMGGDVPGIYGPVPRAVARVGRRCATHTVQRLQQLLRYGRSDQRRNHGL